MPTLKSGRFGGGGGGGAVTSVNGQTGAVVGLDQLQGTWDANANSPALASGIGSKGFYYEVSTAGTTNLDGNSSWSVGDIAFFNGSVWEQIQKFNNTYSKGGAFIASDGLTALTAKTGCPFTFPKAGTIIAVESVADQSTTLVFDIWKSNAALPTIANTITASDKPGLTAATYNKKTSFSGWTLSVAANDVCIVHLDSNNNALQAVCIITVQ